MFVSRLTHKHARVPCFVSCKMFTLLAKSTFPILPNYTMVKRNINETADDAVLRAQQETLNMNINNKNYSPIEKLVLSARILAEEGHGNTLSGQISLREKDNSGNVLMWVNAYGIPFETITSSDFILVDKDMNPIKGNGFPNRATRFHYHVYLNRSDIKSIIHTHPPRTNALSITGLPLLINHMDCMALYEDVQYLSNWPGVPFGDEEGEIISNVLNKNGCKYWSALLAHHGLIVCGKSIEEATYRAVFFERAAEMQLNALAAVGGDINKLPKVNRELALKARDWRISEGPINAHFNAWVNIILNKYGNVTDNPI